MFGLSGLGAKLVAGGAVLVALAGLFLWAEGRGYNRAALECEQRIAAVEAANREAIRTAQERLMRAANEISLKNMERDNVLAELNAAAEADPDGDALCLSPDAAARLQSIQ